MNPVILLLDMDAFYASVEQRDNPALRGQPVIVGNLTPRSIVTTASREARKYGIHSTMPMTTARQLCPHGHFIAPRMDRYREESRVIMEIVSFVAGSDAVVQKVGLDEFYVDLTPYCQGATADASLVMALSFAALMRDFILKGVELTCTIGIASNKMLAKLASDKNKPNGVGFIMESEKVSKLTNEPVKVLHGVGEVREADLKRAGIKTIQDIRNHTGDLRAIVGNDLGSKLKDLADGIDPRPVMPEGPPKSVGREHTFKPVNESDPTVLDSYLLAQAHEVENEMKAWGLVAFTVFVAAAHKWDGDYSRQKSFPVAVSTAQEIYDIARNIVKAEGIYTKPLYLLGLGVRNLCPPGSVPAPTKKKSAAQTAAEKANLTLFDPTKL